jgi:hypothetical protein
MFCNFLSKIDGKGDLCNIVMRVVAPKPHGGGIWMTLWYPEKGGFTCFVSPADGDFPMFVFTR